MMDQCERPDPPLDGSEKDMLLGFLNWNRQTFLCKLDGLDDEQLRRAHEPSGMSLLGMMKHLTDAELMWFRTVFAGEDLTGHWDEKDPATFWRIEPDETTAQIVDGYRREIARANALIAPDGVTMNMPVRNPMTGQESMILRWVIVHMIEETGRHNGHADLMREAIDGQTGE